MSIEPITIPMSIEVNDVTIDSTIETNEVTIESTFDAKIEVVEGGDITVQSLTVTQNGTTTAPTGKAYSPVIVNVPNTYTNSDEGKVVQNGALTSQTSTTKSANGTYDTTTNNQVTVSVPASAVDTGTKSISTNGTHDVVGYASAAVNVPNTYTASDEGKVVDNGVLVAQTSTTVTTNGTYDTTTNDEVVVNVSGGTPTLITKTITANGTYSAEDDDADGYSEVTVNVSGGDEVIRTEIIVNSTGNVNFSDVLAACQTMGYTLTYKDCVLRFRAKGTNAATDAPTNYTFNNHALIVKDWLIWNVGYNRCSYKNGKVSPDSFSGVDLWNTNNPIQNSGDLVNSSRELVNTYASAFQSMGGSGTTVVLYEIPVNWSDFLTTV